LRQVKEEEEQEEQIGSTAWVGYALIIQEPSSHEN